MNNVLILIASDPTYMTFGCWQTHISSDLERCLPQKVRLSSKVCSFPALPHNLLFFNSLPS